MQISQTKNIFFEGLNSLRFFAALAVIITHVELIKNSFKIQNCWSSSKIVFNLGGLGVYFFFVLSGFLITYLLIIEKQKTGTIAVKNFYIRRILRIWPLYFFVLALGFFVLPNFNQINISYLTSPFNQNFNLNLILFLLMLPNLAFSMFPAVPHIGQLWSIGVEEQFYIAWPLIVKNSKKLLNVLIAIIVFLIALKIIILFLGKNYSNTNWYPVIKKLTAMSKFESMAIGGIGAYYFSLNHKIIEFLKSPFLSLAALATILLIIYLIPDKLQDGQHLIISVLFLAIIINVISSNIKLLRNNVFDWLGKISYGIYMYHLMIIPIVIVILTNVISPTDNIIVFNFLLYSLTIFITIFVSWLSYQFFESKFIDLKSKFAIIHSGKK
ncbi:MAG: acyltransferase [Bacteroidetes bacterium]|nr:acyltransferase [Bacteroidota bacterium]